MKLSKLFAAAFALAIFASCSSQKENLTYFSNIEPTSTSGVIESGKYEITIIPDDELLITVSSLAPEATAQYNAPFTAVNTRAEGKTIKSQQSYVSYIVDQEGMIVMPVIGSIKAAGLTTSQLKDVIKDKVSESVKDPYVNVHLVNFRVNVLGAVNGPGAKTVQKERYTVLDAIADAGDLNSYGQRDNVLLIRDEGGKHTYHRLNLNDVNVISSPYFYLRQNDVVYVEPNEILKENSKYNQNNGYKLSVISTIVSAASVIASLVIALTVK